MTIVIPTLHVRPSAQAVPLAAACLASSLSESGARCRLIDLFPAMSAEEMKTLIFKEDSDIVAFPLYVWNRTEILSLSRELRRIEPSLLLIAGGPEASADPLSVLDEGELDAVVVGEGEEVFPRLIQAHQNKLPMNSLPGVVLRGGGAPHSEPPLPTEEGAAHLPSPWLSGLLDPTKYEGVLWETARGCHFGCDFCYDAKGVRGVRPLPLKRIEAELEFFVRSGVSQVWVLDSSFNSPPERGKALLRLLARKAPGIHFHLEAKAEFLDRETARLLANISCSVQVGLQSIHPEVLKELHRPVDPSAIEKNLHLLSSEGVTFGIDLIFGLPGDNYQGFSESLEKALEFAPNQVDTFPLALLPGTPLYSRASSYGLKALNTPPYTVIESATCPEAEMHKCRILAAAADLFYNAGRSVAFFETLVRASKTGPVPFLEEFAHWALHHEKVPEERFFKTEGWTPGEILSLQKGFVSHLFSKTGKSYIVPAAFDILLYHFHYAETLLGHENFPQPLPPDKEFWQTPLQTNHTVRIVPFTYEILDILEMGEVDLEEFTEMFRPVGSVGLFFRRGGDVFCESLEEDFLTLLQGCKEKQSPDQIFGGSIGKEEGMEIVRFALEEGFVTPVA